MRSNHKVEFDNSLPYHEERQRIFRNMLPDELFVPIMDVPRLETDNRGMLDVAYEEKDTKSHQDAFIRKVYLL